MADLVQHNGAKVDYTPTTAKDAGDVVVQNSLVGVVIADISANALGALAVEGVFDFAKAAGSSDAIEAGAKVYWDASEEEATTTSEGNTYLGKAVAAATATATTVRVRLEQ